MPDYQVNFTEECQQKLQLLGTPEVLREALSTVLNDLGESPYAFRQAPVIDEQGQRSVIRFAKTDLYVSEIGVVQSLTLFFGIAESRKQVLVLDVLPSSGFGLDPDSS
ncbi:MAG: hypothetical protein OXB89_00240 [Anaerolineaceae bacterium]|nr:hypothetical protein [Anaerolineaceae bacterium]